jgi:hypothetical protein
MWFVWFGIGLSQLMGRNADGDCDETSNDWDEGACVERSGLG